ncbi:MAG: DUF1345 domain-containing protein [Polyangiales bacterium]
MATSPKPVEPAFPWYDPRRAKGRFIVATALGLSVMASFGDAFAWNVSAIAGFDAASTALLGLSWWIIAPADAAETQRRASSEDPGRTMVWLLVLLSCAISLFAATVVLGAARALGAEARGAVVALCLWAVASAWLLTHSAFTLRYARLFYRDDDEGVGGLVFPGERPPADFDFAYFAFTIGMCFQVSDVTISSPVIRRTVLLHALISFAYNTTILALALNLVFGLFN